MCLCLSHWLNASAVFAFEWVYASDSLGFGERLRVMKKKKPREKHRDTVMQCRLHFFIGDIFTTLNGTMSHSWRCIHFRYTIKINPWDFFRSVMLKLSLMTLPQPFAHRMKLEHNRNNEITEEKRKKNTEKRWIRVREKPTPTMNDPGKP